MSPVRLDYKKSFTTEELKTLSGNLRDLGYNEKEYTNDQLTILARNKERNIEILNQHRKLNVDKIPTIVFACSFEQRDFLVTTE